MLNKLKKQKMLKGLMDSSEKGMPIIKPDMESMIEDKSEGEEEPGEECPHCGMKIKGKC